MTRSRGFSLIELMITLSVMGVLVVLAAPTFTQWIMNSRIRNVAESVQNGLRRARNEASQRGQPVRFEFSNTDGTSSWAICQLVSTNTTCSADSTRAGWIEQFNAAGGAGDVLVGTSAATASATTYSTPVTGVSSSAQGITFTALGRPSDYGATSILRVDAYNTRTGSRRLITTISPGGMVRLCDPDAHVTGSPLGCT